jgi:ferredoxin-NADP reductase
MEKHIVKILETEYVTHNVKRFRVEKPAGYNFIPGQATDVAINQHGLKDELRPFTFTCLNTANYLEFTIKIYTGHNGITEKLGAINAGDELILHEVFGAIAYKGPGVFIAGGAGITPFIAILRQLKSDNKLAGNTLLFANRTEGDIILKNELSKMLGENFVNVIEKPSNPDTPAGFIDEPLLKQYIRNKTAHYYVCGPDKFISAMVENLKNLGVKKSQIVIEE